MHQDDVHGPLGEEEFSSTIRHVLLFLREAGLADTQRLLEREVARKYGIDGGALALPDEDEDDQHGEPKDEALRQIDGKSRESRIIGRIWTQFASERRAPRTFLLTRKCCRAAAPRIGALAETLKYNFCVLNAESDEQEPRLTFTVETRIVEEDCDDPPPRKVRELFRSCA